MAVAQAIGQRKSARVRHQGASLTRRKRGTGVTVSAVSSDPVCLVKDLSINSGAVRLAVREYGGEGTPLILVHGGPGPNLAFWDSFAPRLVDRLGLSPMTSVVTGSRPMPMTIRMKRSLGTFMPLSRGSIWLMPSWSGIPGVAGSP